MTKRFISAFTLAEVMIVIVVIGIVAAITLPIFIQDMSERINSNRQANIAQKVTKAVELMIVNGDYDSFQTTEEFVNGLKKYLKIAKSCDKDHVADCWPTNTVAISDGSRYNVADAKTGAELHSGTSTNTAGLVLADGASIILTFNPNVVPPNAEGNFKPVMKDLPIGGGKTKEFAYTSNATVGIDFVMDVNGSTGPNAETDDDDNYHDIRSFKVASFSNAGCPGFKVNGVCVYMLWKNYKSLNCKDDKNSEYCVTTNYAFDYLAGAKKACKQMGMEVTPRSVFYDIFNTEDKKLPETGTFGTIFRNDGTIDWVEYDKNRSNKYSGDWAYPNNQFNIICVSY